MGRVWGAMVAKEATQCLKKPATSFALLSSRGRPRVCVVVSSPSALLACLLLSSIPIALVFAFVLHNKDLPVPLSACSHLTRLASIPSKDRRAAFTLSPPQLPLSSFQVSGEAHTSKPYLYGLPCDRTTTPARPPTTTPSTHTTSLAAGRRDAAWGRGQHGPSVPPPQAHRTPSQLHGLPG